MYVYCITFYLAILSIYRKGGGLEGLEVFFEKKSQKKYKKNIKLKKNKKYI